MCSVLLTTMDELYLGIKLILLILKCWSGPTTDVEFLSKDSDNLASNSAQSLSFKHPNQQTSIECLLSSEASVVTSVKDKWYEVWGISDDTARYAGGQ